MEKEQLSYEEAIRRAGDAIHRFPLIDVQGVPLMSTIAETWKSVSEFCPDPSDLLISTYPKAGEDATKRVSAYSHEFLLDVGRTTAAGSRSAPEAYTITDPHYCILPTAESPQVA
ncbi:cytosolic sulfotransferase 1-like [Cyprinus carpio]|uniref:Cytosolic sulfotransferase 1-like n=1 Tax=Cyprinus carpio TaxID=7962 RepID=A0A9R0ARM0_CYPCA|nr:cytosolic sulfotransferase 1-like [Cyprinus carpio]